MFSFSLNCHINLAGNVKFDNLDMVNKLWHVYEQDMFSIIGQLQYYPSSSII